METFVFTLWYMRWKIKSWQFFLYLVIICCTFGILCNLCVLCILVDTFFLTRWRDWRSGAGVLVSVFYILVCCIVTNLFWWTHLFLLCAQFGRLVETFILDKSGKMEDEELAYFVPCSFCVFLHFFLFLRNFWWLVETFFKPRVTRSQDVRWGAGAFQQ